MWPQIKEFCSKELDSCLAPLTAPPPPLLLRSPMGAGASAAGADAGSDAKTALLEKIWTSLELTDGKIARVKVWETIMADQEVATLLGNGDAALGTKVLGQMKDTLSGAHSLDTSGTSFFPLQPCASSFCPSSHLT